MGTLMKMQFLGQDTEKLSDRAFKASLSKTQRYARDAFSQSGANLLGVARFMEAAVKAKTNEARHPQVFAKLSAYRGMAEEYNKELNSNSKKLEMRKRVGVRASEPDLQADADVINRKKNACVRQMKLVGTEQLKAAHQIAGGDHASVSIDEKVLDGMMLALKAEQTLTRLDMPHVLEADAAIYNRKKG
jgi:hypothetical protein